MLRWISTATCFCLVLSAGMAAADTVTLRNRIEANGAMVTLGDAFVGTGALSSRPTLARRRSICAGWTATNGSRARSRRWA